MGSTADGGAQILFSHNGQDYRMQTHTLYGGVIEGKISVEGTTRVLATLKVRGRLGVGTSTILVAAFCAGIANDAEECAEVLPVHVVCLTIDRSVSGKAFANFFARGKDVMEPHQLHIVNNTFILRNVETRETIRNGWRADLEPSFQCMRKMLLEFMMEGLELHTDYTEVLLSIEGRA